MMKVGLRPPLRAVKKAVKDKSLAERWAENSADLRVGVKVNRLAER